MYTKAAAQSTPRVGRPPEERQAMARLSFALSHVLRLFRMAAAATGRSVDDVVQLEAALGRAQLPEEYVDVARAIATLTGTPAQGSTSGISAAVHTRFVALLRELARALALPKLEEEIRGLALAVADTAIDPEPLLDMGRRLVASVLVHQSTTEVLEECLQGVDGGIRRLAEDEVQVGHRLSRLRERLVDRPEPQEVEVLRRTLIAETVGLERLVVERREALADLQRQSRMAQRRAERLLSALADATTAALTDPLTSLGNRRALAETVARIAATPTTTGVLVLDLDHFKRVNDTFGHAAGDRVLCQVAEILRAELRGDDHAFRVGGEEIVVLLASCEPSGALRTAERIRERIGRTPTTVGTNRIVVTVSIGAALWTGGASFEATHDVADEALYQAKHLGRNRSVAI